MTKLNQMVDYLIECLPRNEFYSIENIERQLGTSNRVARMVIAEVAKKVPVISLTDRRGYAIIDLSLVDDKDYIKGLIEHQLNDYNSRIEKLLKRSQILQKALKEI